MFRLNKLLRKENTGCVVWLMQLPRCRRRAETRLILYCAVALLSALWTRLCVCRELGAKCFF